MLPLSFLHNKPIWNILLILLKGGHGPMPNSRRIRYFNTAVEARDAFLLDMATHRQNIKEAFDKFGADFCNAVGANYNTVGEHVVSHDLSKINEKVEMEGFIAYYYRFPSNDLPMDCPRRIILCQKALLNHYHTNPSHPEYWVQFKGNHMIAVEMDKEAVVEMILDWIAIGMEPEYSSADEYWGNNRNKKLLHEETIKLVDKLIGIFHENKSKLKKK